MASCDRSRVITWPSSRQRSTSITAVDPRGPRPVGPILGAPDAVDEVKRPRFPAPRARLGASDRRGLKRATSTRWTGSSYSRSPSQHRTLAAPWTVPFAPTPMSTAWLAAGRDRHNTCVRLEDSAEDESACRPPSILCCTCASRSSTSTTLCHVPGAVIKATSFSSLNSNRTRPFAAAMIWTGSDRSPEPEKAPTPTRSLVMTKVACWSEPTRYV